MAFYQQLHCILPSLLVFAAAVSASSSLPALWAEILKLVAPASLKRCEQLRVNPKLLQTIVLWETLLLIFGLILFGPVLGAWPFAVCWLVIGVSIPSIVSSYLIHRQEILFESQLAMAAGLLVNSARANLTVSQGLSDLQKQVNVPLRDVIGDINGYFDGGIPLAEAIRKIRLQLQFEPFTLFSMVLELCLDRGGDIKHPLDKLAASLRDWERIRGRLEAETAAGRMSVLILSFTPVVFSVINMGGGTENVMVFFTTMIGQCVLSVIILMIWTANRWTSKIMRQEIR
jgi:Flp pilus assembly protein TadB